MTGRERITRAIQFASPDRVPLLFPKFGIADAIEVKRLEPAGWKPCREGEDEWGCLWVKPAPDTGVFNQGQIKGYPLWKDNCLADLDHFQWPDPRDPSRYRDLPNALAEAEDKYVIFLEPFTLLERAWSLRGMEQLFIDLRENPKFLHELLERIVDFQLGVLQALKPYQNRIHAYHGGDDWGTQLGPLMSFEHFRKFFKPRYARLIQAAHDLDMHVWLHSDGRIDDLIEDFTEIGLDVIELMSPHTVGIDEIAERYRGRIAIECCVDIQRTLVFGSDADIVDEVRTLIARWGTDRGGLIALDYPDHRAIGVKPAKAKAALDAFLTFGQYR